MFYLTNKSLIFLIIFYFQILNLIWALLNIELRIPNKIIEVSQLNTTVEVIRTANFLKTKFLPPNKNNPHPIVVNAPLVMLNEISSYPLEIISLYN